MVIAFKFVERFRGCALDRSWEEARAPAVWEGDGGVRKMSVWR